MLVEDPASDSLSAIHNDSLIFRARECEDKRLDIGRDKHEIEHWIA